GEEQVTIAFRTAPRTHADAEALEVLDMILDNSVAGLINLNLVQQQRVRSAGSSPWMFNEYGAQYLWGVPKQGQTLEEVEQLLLDQIEIIRQGEFEDWIIPAIVTDFRKRHEQQLEENGPRVSLMRDAFLQGEEWPHAVRTLDRISKLTKKELVRVARKYFGPGYVVAYRRDGQPELPAIGKPPLDPIEIDAARESAFLQRVLAMPVEEIAPAFVEPGRDYTVKPLRDGLPLYYAHNPLNGLFTFTATVEIGTLAEKRLAVAGELLDKAGTPRLSAEALKKEWYKLGTDFSLSVGDQETTINLSGLDANLVPSLALLAELLRHPMIEPATLTEQIAIIKAKREDARKDHRTIHQALYQYNRFGDLAYYRRVLPNAELDKLTVEELIGLIAGLPGYRQTLQYAGSLPLERVAAALAEQYPAPAQPQAPPPYQVMEFRQPGTTEIYFVNKEMAQALVRLEAGDLNARAEPQRYDETLRPAMDLFNEYFSGGMAGIVFQELREARALAYFAGARYYPGYAKEDQSWLVGAIETQADKTSDAVAAFQELLDQLPTSPERFTAAQRALVSQYRTERLGFREVLAAVRDWERKEVAVDPRQWRFEQVQTATLDQVLQLHREHLQNRPRLISIVGDRSKIDLEALARNGKVIELGLEDIFKF
ncbi:MAG: insulinase family protein, partial [Candidatus Latescibacterota bacterium]